MAKRTENKPKKHRNENKKFILIILFLIILLVVAFGVKKLTYKEDLSRTNLVINNNNVTSRIKKDVIVEEDEVYISMEDIQNFFDKYITKDEALSIK